MTKLRKMLGSPDQPEVVSLMSLIQTQSVKTLSRWALQCAERYLPVYEKAFPDDTRLRALCDAVQAYWSGTLPLAALKVQLRQGREIAQQADQAPAAQAAARAIATACAVVQTPTNALGFTFYAAAAAAYDTEGLNAPAEVYDTRAAAELRLLMSALQQMAVPDEPNRAKLSWHC